MAINQETSISVPNRKGKINARVLSEGLGEVQRPLVILHGLLGSSRNWLSVGKALGEKRLVYGLDLPDHGESEWSDSPSFETMSERIVSWLDEEKIEKADWLGHSLGGKVAMRIASYFPDRVEKLVLADIFPRVYPPHHAKDFTAMERLDVANLPDRKTADEHLSQLVADWGLRQFLLTNLERKSDSGFRWIVNLEGLRSNLPTLAGLPYEDREPLECPTLLIYGGRSDFVRQEDLEEAGEFFSDARGARLANAGHNLHVEAKEEFVRVVREFLEG
ncbi:MAG: alpha/beta fold hydrolase [Verrucomicrobiota bacterium]